MADIALLFGIFLLLVIFFRVPIAYSLGISGLLMLIWKTNVPLEVALQRVFVSIDSLSLLAIPFFIVAGDLMVYGGISTRLIRFASNVVSRFRGGLAMSSVFASMIFSGVSGSALADTTAVGSVAMPAMIQKGYKKPFVSAIQACAGTMGPIIPPSIAMVLYGSLTGVSIGALFLAGIIPGILIGIALMIYCYFHARKENIPREQGVPMKEVLKSGLDAFWALMLPVLIIAGIIFGFFTPTEAGMVAVVYSLVVGLFIYKELTWKAIIKTFADAAITTASVMVIVGMAGIFGWMLAYIQFPKMAIEFLSSITENGILAMLIIVVFLLIIGLLMEELSALTIFVPVLTPFVAAYGYDPIHFAVVFIVTLMMGLVVPPVGILLSVTTAMTKTSMIHAVPYALRMVGVMLLVILAIVFIPQLATYIPSLVFN